MVGTQIFLWTACIASAFVQAHPGPHTPADPAILARRAEKSQKCGDAIGGMKQKRHAQRKRGEALSKRGLRPGIDDAETDFVIHGEAPKYDFIKNESCILTPEVSQGPYWYPQSEILRRDIREGQPGIPLDLEIGVIDVNSCDPVDDILLSIWHCNATGSYSSFAGLSPNVNFGEIRKEANLSASGGTDFTELATDNSTWLRGMWPTDKHGATSFKSIVPGFYIGRTLHIHVQAHTDWNVTMNGTIGAGRTVETGQIFFEEELTQQLMAVEPYASHTEIDRLPNYIDGIFVEESQTGAMTLLDTEPLDGENYENGVLGYITLAIDTSTIKNGTSAPLPGVSLNRSSILAEHSATALP